MYMSNLFILETLNFEKCLIKALVYACKEHNEASARDCYQWEKRKFNVKRVDKWVTLP